jgi:hypothetical protein
MMMNHNLSAVIASAAKQSIEPHAVLWIASSQVLLAMTAMSNDGINEQQNSTGG